jgi:hypothetical protein
MRNQKNLPSLVRQRLGEMVSAQHLLIPPQDSKRALAMLAHYHSMSMEGEGELRLHSQWQMVKVSTLPAAGQAQ